jgi:hypothetical protein
VESLPPSPGAVIAVDDDALGEAILAGAKARGFKRARRDEIADIVVVTRTSVNENLAQALRRCRDRGTVIFVGDDQISHLDLYTDVHRRGLRLAFRSAQMPGPEGARYRANAGLPEMPFDS